MASKKITVYPVLLHGDSDGGFTTSVSVATPNALVVIQELGFISDTTLAAYAVVTEDEQDAV